ncbi:MAG: hypothetical protein LBI27_09520 [Clostridiales bacterium]|jgi:hypothetical protein|nr:hypothetical protein [Clostridiales bacterium]
MSFLPENVGMLYQKFSRYLSRECNAGCKPPKYTETYGWVYSFGRYNINLINQVSMQDGAFYVQELRVSDEASLKKAIETAASMYNDYKERLALTVAEKIEKQKHRVQKRREKDQDELNALSDVIESERFNKFRWSPKLRKEILKRLYKKDAMGIQDEELADEVGYTLYARCLQGRDEGRLKDEGKLKCHNCREILQAKTRTGLMICTCGHQYIFRDYMKSFRTENMPHGGAAAIFGEFITNWSRAKGYAEKMRLIDNLIHEFHINLNSGVKGRFVGINLIEGTKKQIGAFILDLAYGDTENKEKFKSNLMKTTSVQ